MSLRQTWRAMRPKTKWALALGVAAVFLWSRRSRAGALGLGGSRMVIPLGQCDPRWKDKPVGTSSRSYCAIGCVATAMTMAVNALRGTSFTPDDLMPGGRAGLGAQHYIGGAMKTGSVAEALGCKIVGRIEPSLDNRSPSGLARLRASIDDTLSRGGLALVRVDYDLSSPESNHTIVCFKKTAEGYECIDPANGKSMVLSLGDLFFRKSATKTYSAVGVAPIFRA